MLCHLPSPSSEGSGVCWRKAKPSLPGYRFDSVSVTSKHAPGSTHRSKPLHSFSAGLWAAMSCAEHREARLKGQGGKAACPAKNQGQEQMRLWKPCEHPPALLQLGEKSLTAAFLFTPANSPRGAVGQWSLVCPGQFTVIFLSFQGMETWQLWKEAGAGARRRCGIAGDDSADKWDSSSFISFKRESEAAAGKG